MVPKAEHAAGLARLGERCPGGLIALVETARGVRGVDAVAATPGVERLALGTIDLAAGLGVDPDAWAALAYSRGRLVISSAAAGIAAPIDGVTTALGDPVALASDTRAARALGFTGKLCIHPRQVEVVHEEFRPGIDEIRWARRVVAESSSGGVAVVDGAMVDAPVVARAHAILSRVDLS
jgi:citrate lyase subunit beta/citryl-CoA lyase